MRTFKIYLVLMFVAAHLTAIAQAEDEPTPSPAAEEETIPSAPDYLIDRPDFVAGSPYYLNVQSKWAFGLRFGISGVPVPGALGNTFQIYGERMFPFFSFGYLSGGIHIGTLPLYLPSAEVPFPNYSNSIAGAQIRYQLKFSKAPLIVPIASIEWEFYQVKESQHNQNILTGHDFGTSFGVMINAGFVDRMTERDAHRSIGLTRAYFTAELRSANLNNSLFSLSGNYWLWGMRVELQ